MTLKIQTYQSKGIKTDHIVEEFEFCCWEKLYLWLKKFHGLNKCPKCSSTLSNKQRKDNE